MSNRNDLQYFRITGNLLIACNEWLDNVYNPRINEIKSYLSEEFGYMEFRTTRDFNGVNNLHSIPVNDDKVPYGMKALKDDSKFMSPNAKTTKGKVYATKFKELTIPITCENVMDALFGDKDTAYWGNGYYRRANIFILNSCFYLVCDVDQAISMKFDEHEDLVQLMPIQMRRLELNESI